MEGIYSAMLGVEDGNGNVDQAAIAKLVRHNIDHCGVDGLYINGSTGESFLMPLKARIKTLEVAAREANGQIRMIAHIGGNVREDVFAQAEAAEACGYDAISAVTPFYYKFSADEIAGYYLDIAKHCALPLIIYYIPALSGVSLSAKSLIDLLNIPNVIGLKFTSNELFLLERLRKACPNKLIYSGFDEMLLSATGLSTNGAIGSTYNIIGHWAKRVFTAVRSGDMDTARKWQARMNDVIEKLIAAGLYPTIKEIVRLYGVPIGGCRWPMGETTDAHRAAAQDIHAYMEKADHEH